MSLSVSEEEQAIFTIVGNSIIWTATGGVTESGLWAVYLVLFSSSIYRSRGIRNPADVALFAVSITLFVSSAALWAMALTSMLAVMKGLLNYPTLSLEDRIIKLNEEIMCLWVPEKALFLVTMITGDTVVI
ncbi:hypothetical protein WG66_016171, partial [Moniliophthora roreri]